MKELFNKITSNGCREMTEARFNEALKEYKQSILTLVDNEIKENYNDYFKMPNNLELEILLNRLKQKIEAL